MNPTRKLEEIMETLTKDGYHYQVSRRDIEKAIIETRGIDKRTVTRWIELLELFKFLERENRNVWRINITKLNIGELLRNKPQTRIS